MIYKIRIILNIEEDVFRDIEIKGNQTLGKLHEAIKSAFSLQGEEMASFYKVDDQWNQLEEIPLEDMTDDGSGETMYDIFVKEVLKNTNDRLLYVYDFLALWTFYVEVLEINENVVTKKYPQTVFRYGKMPLKMPSNTQMKGETLSIDIEESEFEEGELDDSIFDDIDQNTDFDD